MTAKKTDPTTNIVPPTDPARPDPGASTITTPNQHPDPAPAADTVAQTPSLAHQLIRQLMPGAPGAVPHPLPAVPGYVMSREIACGGMGVVYAAHDPAFDREVAIKVMYPGQDARSVRDRVEGDGSTPPPPASHLCMPWAHSRTADRSWR